MRILSPLNFVTKDMCVRAVYQYCQGCNSFKCIEDGESLEHRKPADLNMLPWLSYKRLPFTEHDPLTSSVTRAAFRPYIQDTKTSLFLECLITQCPLHLAAKPVCLMNSMLSGKRIWTWIFQQYLEWAASSYAVYGPQKTTVLALGDPLYFSTCRCLCIFGALSAVWYSCHV